MAIGARLGTWDLLGYDVKQRGKGVTITTCDFWYLGPIFLTNRVSVNVEESREYVPGFQLDVRHAGARNGRP